MNYLLSYKEPMAWIFYTTLKALNVNDKSVSAPITINANNDGKKNWNPNK